MAEVSFLSRDREAAKVCFEEALKVTPNDTYVLHQYGLLMQEEFGDRNQAEALIRKAVECNPDNFAAWTSLGNTMKGRQEFDGAMECYDKALSIRGDYGRALKNKGLLLEQLHRYAEARASYERAIKMDPNNASVYVVLGQLLQTHFRDNRSAATYFEGAIHADPDNPQGYLRLAVLKDMGKDFVGAKALYESALKLDLSDSKTLQKYATVLEALNEVEAAIHALSLAHEAASHFTRQRIATDLRRMCKKHFPKLLAAKALPTPADVVTEIGGMISIMVPSSSEVYTAPSRTDLQCPQGHYILHVRRKPFTYKPKATWACEECKHSIGGTELKVHGAYYCDTCKYDVCYSCSRDVRVAHVFPEKPVRIGCGGFGAVYKEFVREFGTYCAVKHIPLVHAAGVKQEVALMQMFQSHPNIIRVLKYEADNREARIVMELMEDGSVANLLKQRTVLHEGEAWRILRDALRGLDALHRAKPNAVVHRDIKPDNLLMSASGVVKLADFGISKQQAIVSALQSATGHLQGTPHFLPPECFHRKPKWSTASDVWALGCTWIALTSGQHPYHDDLVHGTSALQVYAQLSLRFAQDLAFHPSIPKALSPAARTLLGRIFVRDPKQRISVAALLHDAYFDRTVAPHDGLEPEAAFQQRILDVQEDMLRHRSDSGADYDEPWPEEALGINSAGLPVTTTSTSTQALTDPPAVVAAEPVEPPPSARRRDSPHPRRRVTFADGCDRKQRDGPMKSEARMVSVGDAVADSNAAQQKARRLSMKKASVVAFLLMAVLVAAVLFYGRNPPVRVS